MARRLGDRRRDRGVGELPHSTCRRRACWCSGSSSSRARRPAAIVPLRYGKWVPSSGAIGQIGAAHVLHRLGRRLRRRARLPRPRAGRLLARATVFIAIVPILLYSFVGIELPSTAGEEMVDPRRDIPIAIARAGFGQLLMYGVPILAVLFVLPAEQMSSLHGLIDAMGPSSPCTAVGEAGTPASGRVACAAPRSSGCCSPAARRGSWAPAARRPPPASTAPGRRCSAGSASAPACRW